MNDLLHNLVVCILLGHNIILFTSINETIAPFNFLHIGQFHVAHIYLFIMMIVVLTPPLHSIYIQTTSLNSTITAQRQDIKFLTKLANESGYFYLGNNTVVERITHIQKQTASCLECSKLLRKKC